MGGPRLGQNALLRQDDGSASDDVGGKAGREGLIVCGREFMNSLADSSFAEVKAAIASEPIR